MPHPSRTAADSRFPRECAYVGSDVKPQRYLQPRWVEMEFGITADIKTTPLKPQGKTLKCRQQLQRKRLQFYRRRFGFRQQVERHTSQDVHVCGDAYIADDDNDVYQRLLRAEFSRIGSHLDFIRHEHAGYPPAQRVPSCGFGAEYLR